MNFTRTLQPVNIAFTCPRCDAPGAVVGQTTGEDLYTRCHVCRAEITLAQEKDQWIARPHTKSR